MYTATAMAEPMFSPAAAPKVGRRINAHRRDRAQRGPVAGALGALAAKPKNTALPVISGQAVVGSTLTSSAGTWVNSPTGYQYNWRRCDTTGANCTRITGLQASSNYTLGSADQGHTIDVNVQACNASGCSVKTSNPTSVVQPASQPPGSGLLVGNETLEPTSDSNADGSAQAWSFTASASGTATGVQVYVNSGSSGSLSAGIYSDNGGSPGTLLASTSVPNTPGQWEQATFTNGPQITQGTKYWLALLGTGGGTFNFRDNSAGACTTVGGQSASSLLSTWSTAWTANGYCPASLYVTGTGTALTAPRNTSPPTISGTATQGDTLTASPGSWSGNPAPSFSYQWQDNGTNISGATSGTYTLRASDVGDDVDVVVTASNGQGNASATSSPVGPVAASGGGGSGCDLNATTSNFSSQVSAATSGQTVCLASGTYPSAWAGTNKAITVTAAPGATVVLGYNFGSSATNFTIDGSAGGGTMSSPGGDISNVKNVTIRNVAFTNTVDVGAGSNMNLLFDHDSFNDQNEAANCQDEPARLHLSYDNGSVPSGVTVENSEFVDPAGGLSNPKDGIQTGSGMVIKNNLFENILDNPSSCNHTDSIQGVGAQGVVVTGNFFINDADAMVDFDDPTSDTVTDNACTRIQNYGGACVVFYGDLDSTVNHNTSGGGLAMLLSYKTGSGYRGSSTGTVIQNNVGSVDAGDPNDHPATVTNNLFQGATSPNIAGTPTFSGGVSPTTWSGFELAPGSAGKGAATDGTDVGIRASAGGPPG